MCRAGRDFHVFNVLFRNNDKAEVCPSHIDAEPLTAAAWTLLSVPLTGKTHVLQVVAFTATQIHGIDDKKYPPELSGPLYPEGIQIYPEAELQDLIKINGVNK